LRLDKENKKGITLTSKRREGVHRQCDTFFKYNYKIIQKKAIREG